MITSDRIIKEIKDARKKHGGCCFIDQLPEDVMDVKSIFRKLLKLDDDKVIEILTGVYEGHQDGCTVIDDIYRQYDEVNDDGKYNTIVRHLTKHLT